MTKLFSRACALSIVLALAACSSSTPANDAAVSTDVNNIPTFDVGNDAASLADAACAPHTFVITTPTFAYTIDGVGNNPTITLCRGIQYTFDLTGVVGDHPIRITAGSATVLDVSVGSTITYTIPPGGPNPDHYLCSVHTFGGAVTVQ